MTELLSEKQERDFLQFFEWGWGVRGAAYASRVPEHVAYAFLLELDGFEFDPADADDVPCPCVIKAVYEHLRHGCGCNELQVADGLGIGRPQFCRWMAKSGPRGLPACQELAREMTRAFGEACDAVEARTRRDAATGKDSSRDGEATDRGYIAPGREQQAHEAHADLVLASPALLRGAPARTGAFRALIAGQPRGPSRRLRTVTAARTIYRRAPDVMI